jgi:hypothetical protein
MKKFLLALPLFLVVGLFFVELPNGNSTPNNVSPASATSTPQVTPIAEPAQPPVATPKNIAPSKATKSKIDIGGKKPKHSNDDEENESEEEDD